MKILLFREHANDPLSKLIQAVTRSQYTHAAILVESAQAADGSFSHNIVEAFYPKVRARALLPAELPGINVFDVTLTREQQDNALAWIGDHMGDPYSVLDLFRFLAAVRDVFGEDNLHGGANHHFCSMFAFQGLLAAGVEPLARIEPWAVSPALLSYSPLLTVADPLAPIA